MASLRKRGKGGHYYGRFYDGSRSPKQKTVALNTTRKRIARKRLSRLEEEFQEGTFDPWNPDSGPEVLSVSDAVERFLSDKEGRVRPRTVKTYRGILERWQEVLPAGLRLRNVREEHLRPFIYQPSTANATRRKRYRHLKAFLRWAKKCGLLREVPITDDLKPKNEKKTPAFLTPEQLERLLTAIDAHVELLKDQPGPTPDVQWLRDAIEIAAGTGLRRGELLNLRWEDVDLAARRLYVRNRNGFKTKSGQERTVPVRGAALRVLRRRREASSGSGRVIVDRDGLPVKPGRVSRRFKDMVRKAKLRGREDMRFHSLRHSCGAWLASQGVSSRIIQEVLGHVTPRTTEIYSHLMGPAVEDAMERTFGTDHR